MVFIVVVIALILFVGSVSTRDFVYNRVEYRTNISRAEFLKANALLEAKSPFYAGLSRHGRARFLSRLRRFLKDKKWQGRQGLELQPAMLLLASAASVQLTWGLRNYRLSNIHTIRLYPTVFEVTLIQKSLRGGTSPGGIMMLSWKHLEHGFNVPTDRINLAIHEMAHALHLEIKYGSSPDAHFAAGLERWFDEGLDVYKDVRSNRQHFLRKYAGTNRHEYFAVCAEHFFESPAEFYRELPELFVGFCELLNQNPLNPNADYRLKLLNTSKGKRLVLAGSRRKRMPKH